MRRKDGRRKGKHTWPVRPLLDTTAYRPEDVSAVELAEPCRRLIIAPSHGAETKEGLGKVLLAGATERSRDAIQEGEVRGHLLVDEVEQLDL